MKAENAAVAGILEQITSRDSPNLDLGRNGAMLEVFLPHEER